jgi:hypothetical protein
LPTGARTGRLSGHYPAFRYYADLRLLLGHRPSSLGPPAYRPQAEPSRSPGVRRRDFVVIPSPLRPLTQRQESGFAAGRQLARQRAPYGASLSFATTTHLWLLSDPPSRKPADAKRQRQPAARSIPGRALASSVLGSPCQGPRSGLSPPISYVMSGTRPAAGPDGLPLSRCACARRWFPPHCR